MNKPKGRARLELKTLAAEPASPAPAEAAPAPDPAGAEPTAVIYARVPWSVAAKLKAAAWKQSQVRRRRVSAQELLIEIISKLDS